MSDKTTVSDSDSEENTIKTPDAESENTQAGEGEEPKTPEADEGEGKDKAKAFDESLLEMEDSNKTPPTTEDKENIAAFNQSKKINTFFDRVANGKINPTTNKEWSLDDIDEVWVKNAVSDKLGEISKPVEKKKEAANENDVYERIKYDQLIESIPELPQSKQKAIADLSKELQAEGVQSKYKALKRALEISNIELEAERRGKKAALMGAPGGGSSGGINKVDNKKKLSPEFMKTTGITKEIVKKAENFNFLNPSENAS